MVGSEFLLVGILSANHYRFMKLVEAELAGVRAKERRSKQFVPNELQADQLLITPTIGRCKSLLNLSGLCFNGHNAASVKKISISEVLWFPCTFSQTGNSFGKSKIKLKSPI